MKLDSLIERASQFGEKTVAVAAAEDEEVLEAICHALQLNLARFLLFGDKEKISAMMERKFPGMHQHQKLEMIHTPTNSLAVEKAVRAVHIGEANVLMKGNVQTATLLKTILNKEYGLRTGRILSQVAVFEIPDFERFIFITDSAMNMEPNVEQKAEIISNAVQIARSIGLECPLVAPIAAVEVVNPNMQATIDAAILTQMNRRGQIVNCIVDGPLGFDNAVSISAAEHKSINSEVAGRADILLVPTLEVGNALYKSLTYFAKAKVSSVIAGAKAPIVLTSRADTAEAKFNSLVLAICSANES
ncbi:phosphate butyryltransferase [Robertmurraya andreesenii]|uniref:Phosphate butyryltransferase n=1 Tax=Anoxybacillus andreesenii TaxID=1325932 RepID=A0ABT9V697_9BACL|nr:phosphate butyryltransferase [Robertmurraya andreesenii]MDQ0156452.1 phosphate butyryltransferase [Robertmurraya andreesenii]